VLDGRDDDGITGVERRWGVRNGSVAPKGVVIDGGEDEGNKVLGSKGDNKGVELPEMCEGKRVADEGRSELEKRGDSNCGRLLCR
jgi:hypothetical protein